MNRKLKKAIKKTTRELTGYYSVFLYDKSTDNLFYFRYNADFDIMVYDKNLLIGSTDSDNFNSVFLDNFIVNDDKREYYKLADEVIYHIKDDVYRLGEFKANSATKWTYTENEERNLIEENKNISLNEIVDKTAKYPLISYELIDDLLWEVFGLQASYEITEDKERIKIANEDKQHALNKCGVYAFHIDKDVFIDIKDLFDLSAQNQNYVEDYV